MLIIALGQSRDHISLNVHDHTLRKIHGVMILVILREVNIILKRVGFSRLDSYGSGWGPMQRSGEHGNNICLP